MRNFQITIHARSRDVGAGATVALAGQSWPTLAVPSEALSATFDCSFEEASAALRGLERMFLEPDGSFVWVSSAQEPAWQLDGVLYDRSDRLLLVELKGQCPEAQFDRLLTALGWPDTPVIVQLVREAVFLDEATFRRYAGWSAP